MIGKNFDSNKKEMFFVKFDTLLILLIIKVTNLCIMLLLMLCKIVLVVENKVVKIV